MYETGGTEHRPIKRWESQWGDKMKKYWWVFLVTGITAAALAVLTFMIIMRLRG